MAKTGMKKRKIPSNMQPWKANINGKEYEYESGITAEVPDEVAALIDFIDESAPKRDPKAAQRAIEDEVTQIVKDNFAGGVGYEETSEVVMLPETSFEVVAENQGGVISDSSPYTFEVGQDYTVTLDGETKTYTAIDYNGIGALTNTSLADVRAGNGWLIVVSDGVVGLSTLDSSLVGAHTISISKSVNTVHRIDSLFMKEDMPLYVLDSGGLAASKHGTALEPIELVEMFKTKHCYIYEPHLSADGVHLGDEVCMEILSYIVSRTNNEVVAVKCFYIDSSSKIKTTQNG